MMDVQKIRQDLLEYIRDHPGTDKWTVLKTVCPDCQKTGFIILKGLIDEGMVCVDFIHTETEEANTRIVRPALDLNSKGQDVRGGGRMIEDDMVNDALIQEALQYIADHGKVTVGNVATMLMVEMEITPAQAQEILIALVADGKVKYTPATLEVRE
ncbi:MAG: hypothetical protein ACI381_05515 [Candidatus Methanomethylophilaceae archaeon]